MLYSHNSQMKVFHNRKRRWTTQIRFGQILHTSEHAVPHPPSPDPNTPSSPHSQHAATTSSNHHLNNNEAILQSAINLLNLNNPIPTTQLLDVSIPNNTPDPVDTYILPVTQTVPQTLTNSLVSTNSSSTNPGSEETANNLHVDNPPSHPIHLGNGINSTSFSIRSSWLPPTESNLKWHWIKGNGDAGDVRKLLFNIIYVCKLIVFLCFRS